VLMQPADPRRVLLWPELSGYLAGFAYYAAHRRDRGDGFPVTPAA
jgi:hypothetical protein